MNLIIVESKAKTKTISKFVGKDYEVDYCSGHIYDLPENNIGIKVTTDEIKPIYTPIASKQNIINKLKENSEKMEKIYLASDPDREGEIIAWHLYSKVFNDSKEVWRITFNEITKSAIISSLNQPRKIDMNLVSSQQARRILDRFVGYEISPLLWKNVKGGLSAGRVQSIALRIICDRETEIEKFIPKEYWKIDCILFPSSKEKEIFTATIGKKDGVKLEISDEKTAYSISDELKNCKFYVKSITIKEENVKSIPPFNTSSLQQEAVRALGFTVKRTMQIAQQLYEGIEIGEEGAVGLVTYIRTDSLRVTSSAQDEARQYIQTNFNEKYLPHKIPVYKSPKSAQEAHESIRPTSVFRESDKIKNFLSEEQYKLYDLIWCRFLASQMTPAVNEKTNVEITAERYQLMAQKTILLFDGSLKVYGKFLRKEKNDGEDKNLPQLKEGELLILKDINNTQNFTKPASRYTEATLVKTLEEKGIGRPSTYSPTLTTLQDREYIQKRKNILYPTKLGMIVNDLLVKNFPDILDIDFTAKLEEKLDEIERGNLDWQKIVKDFYFSFKKDIDKAKKEMKVNEVLEEKCSKCGAQMVLKGGRYGPFYACSNFPNCKNVISLNHRTGEKKLPEETDKICESCGEKMLLREGKFGKFYSCSGYPKCKNTISMSNLEFNCPKENCNGKLTRRKSKKGKYFYGCSNYPQCNFSTFYPPSEKKCPQCGNGLLKNFKGDFLCPKDNCKWKGTLE